MDDVAQREGVVQFDDTGEYRCPAGYGLMGTKTNDIRRIPLPEILEKELFDLRSEQDEDFLFSADGGVTPIHRSIISRKFRAALVRIGISKDDQKERFITFHSWRHYFNTILRSNNISDGKVQSLTGHKSQAMTEHYTHFKPEDYEDVKAIQNKIIPFTRAGRTAMLGPALRPETTQGCHPRLCRGPDWSLYDGF